MEFTKSLKQNHIFRRLYSKGKSSAGSCLVVYCKKNGLPFNRLGLTASTKLGHAVVRNRVRRRIREAYRLNEAKLRYGYDIVIVARHAAIDADFDVLTACLLHQLENLGMLRKELIHEEVASASNPVLPE